MTDVIPGDASKKVTEADTYLSRAFRGELRLRWEVIQKFENWRDSLWLGKQLFQS